MGHRKDYETMNELYEASYKRRAELSTKRGETVESSNEVEENVEDNKKSLLDYILIPLVLAYRTFIGVPTHKSSEFMHFLMGVTKSVTYIYILYNIPSITDYIESFEFSDGFRIVTMFVISVFSLIQTLLGSFVTTGAFTLDTTPAPSGLPRGHSIRMRSSSSYMVGDDSGKEYNQTMRYMDAKMTGMSNRKKEKYLSDFYGGKLNKK